MIFKNTVTNELYSCNLIKEFAEHINASSQSVAAMLRRVNKYKDWIAIEDMTKPLSGDIIASDERKIEYASGAIQYRKYVSLASPLKSTPIVKTQVVYTDKVITYRWNEKDYYVLGCPVCDISTFINIEDLLKAVPSTPPLVDGFAFFEEKEWSGLDNDIHYISCVFTKAGASILKDIFALGSKYYGDFLKSRQPNPGMLFI